MALLLTAIDELHRGDHWYLKNGDLCFFLREYQAGKDFTHGETNNMVSNMKKKPSVKGQPQYRYKIRDIRRAGQEMQLAAAPWAPWLNGATIVPMPPSKAKDHADYDDRVVQIAQAMCAGTGAQVRELLVRTDSIAAMHTQTTKRDLNRLYETMKVDPRIALPAPTHIGIVDDVLTTGASFVTARRRLWEQYGEGVQVVGFFFARRIPSSNQQDS